MFIYTSSLRCNLGDCQLPCIRQYKANLPGYMNVQLLKVDGTESNRQQA